MASKNTKKTAGPDQPPDDHRAKTGRVVTAASKIGRDAKTGQFVPVKVANRRPSTTVIETIRKTSPKGGGGKGKK